MYIQRAFIKLMVFLINLFRTNKVHRVLVFQIIYYINLNSNDLNQFNSEENKIKLFENSWQHTFNNEICIFVYALGLIHFLYIFL